MKLTKFFKKKYMNKINSSLKDSRQQNTGCSLHISTLSLIQFKVSPSNISLQVYNLLSAPVHSIFFLMLFPCLQDIQRCQKIHTTFGTVPERNSCSYSLRSDWLSFPLC